MNGAVSFLLAWILLFVILYALAKNKWGHPLIYYGAWLVAILLIVMNGKTIAGLLGATGLAGGN
jgi:hypothetical protein